MKVKYTAEIETPTEYTGYNVDGAIVPFDEGNRDYQEVQEWIAEGNTPEDAYTQEELDEYERQKNIAIQNSMLEEGNKVTIVNDSRIEVGANPIIEDKVEFNAWMKNIYDEKDGEGEALYKPPANERQMLSIVDEDVDRYTFTRYQDQWGYRWLMKLKRADTTNLALYIMDASGGYLYTPGRLIPCDDEENCFYCEAPAGQATITPENLYFRFILGSAPISQDMIYKGTDTTLSGTVRYDSRYDEAI